MPSPSPASRSLCALAFMLAATSLAAQSSGPPPAAWQYWVSAGAGHATTSDNWNPLGHGATAMVVAATVQHHSLVASGRWARAGASSPSAWDLGLLAGLGTSTRYPVRGSLAAGLGRVESRLGQSGVTFPVELQLSWRLTPTIGLGTYGFGNFGGPAQSLGATLMLQLGRLR